MIKTEDILKRAKAAATDAAPLDSEMKNKAIRLMADALTDAA